MGHKNLTNETGEDRRSARDYCSSNQTSKIKRALAASSFHNFRRRGVVFLQQKEHAESTALQTLSTYVGRFMGFPALFLARNAFLKAPILTNSVTSINPPSRTIPSSRTTCVWSKCTIRRPSLINVSSSCCDVPLLSTFYIYHGGTIHGECLTHQQIWRVVFLVVVVVVVVVAAVCGRGGAQATSRSSKKCVSISFLKLKTP